MTDWISTDEQLPRELRELVAVLIVDKVHRGMMNGGGYDYLVDRAWLDRGVWRNDVVGDMSGDPYEFNEVTHWMPLPIAPQLKETRP